MASIYQLEQSIARLEIEKINIEARIKHAKNQLGLAIIRGKNGKVQNKKIGK